MNPLSSIAAVLLAVILPVASARAATTPSVVDAVFDSATTVPVTAASFAAAGNTVNLSLTFAPTNGTLLTVINNTGLAFIGGEIDNLAQGQAVGLVYNGITYPFVANYYGGTGNDLVLQWGKVRPAAWGWGSSGQLGNGGVANSNVPVAVNTSGVLADQAILAFEMDRCGKLSCG